MEDKNHHKPNTLPNKSIQGDKGDDAMFTSVSSSLDKIKKAKMSKVEYL